MNNRSETFKKRSVLRLKRGGMILLRIDIDQRCRVFVQMKKGKWGESVILEKKKQLSSQSYKKWKN